ncbi:mismatch-specific DNA-glycosylase [Gordonia sp. DT30]|uniref:mismatch-specific DNA-glycosylase n=1 Tax=unclassified Gordonia (in: high G+C Gram-positive bacteria) TaxID=2657482 RepID=UPI003CF2543D
MGFTRDELLSYRNAEVRDLIGPGCRLMFVGINPGLWSAATGAHFARRGNRFYPALYRAGITHHLIDASAGMRQADRDALIDSGIGITNVVSRASATAAELTPAELRSGGQRLRETVRRVAPRVVAILGITAYRTAFGQRRAETGKQADPVDWSGAQLWVVPNPSGLNAHETVDTLAVAYREAAIAAGVIEA